MWETSDAIFQIQTCHMKQPDIDSMLPSDLVKVEPFAHDFDVKKTCTSITDCSSSLSGVSSMDKIIIIIYINQ